MKKKSKVKINLSELMWQHRIKSIHKLHEETQISRPALSRMYHNETKYLDTKTLITLCDYFGCSLNDLIEYDPHKEVI